VRLTALPSRTPRRAGPSVSGRDGRRTSLPLALAIGVALLSTATGVYLLVARGSGDGATLGGLSVQVGEAGWVTMDAHTMDNQGGYQMPAQMMPGAPAGDDMRLGIPLVIVNTSDEVRTFDTGREFTLVGGVSDAPVRIHSDTFGLLRRLNPDSAVNGVLYFDTKVPAATDPPLALQWSRDSGSLRLTLPWVGAGPASHPHGP